MNCRRSINSSKNNGKGNAFLELDSIFVWQVSSSTFRTYMVSLEAARSDGSTRRIILGKNSSEASVIGRYQRSGNCAINGCSAACLMSSEEQESYSDYFEQGDFERCLDSLMTFEENLNRRYGFQTKEKVYHR